MAKFVIHGGRKLKGELKVNTAKNSAVALLCACLMLKGKSVLKDMPRLQEVDRILEILVSIGVKAEWKNSHTLALDTRGELQMDKINRAACEATRSSLLLLGALAGRESGYKLYKSGGCKLGRRTVRPHLYALNKFGIHVDSKEKFYDVKNHPLKLAEIVMYESGDTACENLLTAAALIPGKTTLKFASPNYMVQEICFFLEKLGVRVEGNGTTTISIHGVKEINKNVQKITEATPAGDPLWAAVIDAISNASDSFTKILTDGEAGLALGQKVREDLGRA